MPLRILHLAGSAVSDFHADLSRLYAGGCLDALPGYDNVVAFVTPDRRWRFPVDLSPAAIRAAGPVTLTEAVDRLARLKPDLAVPQMFCLPGMTSYRALLDVIGIPYLGNTPDIMALAADKAHAKAVVGAAGVAVPAGELLRRGETPAMQPPVVVKPVDADNSLGLSLVTDAKDYGAALRTAFEYSDSVLVEQYVELGREVRCAVLSRAGELVCLPLEEYDVGVTKPVRGYADKLSDAGDGELMLMAKAPGRAWIVDPADPVTRPVWEAARRCHLALGCRHYSLFDFRIDPAGRPWFLEAGLYCSFSPQSVITVMAAAAGLTLDDLFVDTIAEATSR